MRLTVLRCPGCGAPLGVDDLERASTGATSARVLAGCSYCGAAIAVRDETPAEVGREIARSPVRCHGF